MIKQCLICNKKSILRGQRKKLMSRYNPLPKKRKYPNLQWIKVPLDVKHKSFRKFKGKKILACAKCIKTLSKIDY